MVIKIVKRDGKYFIKPAEDKAEMSLPTTGIDTSILDAFIRGQGALVDGGLDDDVANVGIDDETEDTRTI